uniref:ditrans,polycis-polyprenyl diphosphate synthase [(2E,6E)-farnesyldiphosphate specific] n=1 Tax=Xenopsylla cheopis TaxID=163159 RepID=A0A6M2DZZ9_XENCH
MMFSDLYYVIWSLIHIVFSLIKKLVFSWEFVKMKCYELTYHEDSIKNEVECISSSVKLFTKIPKHVVLILGTEKPSYDDLSKLLMWCIAAGISFVSFYDHNGTLKKNEIELHKAISKKRKDIEGRIVWGRKIKTDPIYKNGYQNECIDPVTVNLLSLGDGRGKVLCM